MSILDVAHLSHSYGGREIFEDVSFRLEKVFLICILKTTAVVFKIRFHKKSYCRDSLTDRCATVPEGNEQQCSSPLRPHL